MGGEGARPMREIVRALLEQTGIKARQQINDVQDAWIRSVPSHVAANTRVIGLRNQVLTVLVGSATLKQEIDSFMRDHILERLRQNLPDRRINRLRLTLANPGAVHP